MPTIKKIFSFLALFYEHTGWRLPVLFALIAVSGVTEVLGIVTVLPLLNVASGEAPDSALSSTIVGTLSDVGIEATIGNLLIVIVVVFVVRAVFVFIYTYFTARITVSARRNVQLSLTRKFNEMSYRFFAKHATGWFSNLIVVETGRFISSLRAFANLSVNAVNVLVFLPVALVLNFELTLLVFAVGSFVLWALMGFVRKTARLSRAQTINAGILNADFIQLIQSFIYLKATNTMGAVARHVEASIGRLANNELRIRKIGAIFASINEPIAVAVLAAYIFYEVAVLEGSISEVLVFAIILYRMLIKLVSLGPQLQGFNQNIGGLFAIEDVSRALERHSEPNGLRDVASLDQPIEFHDVSYRHGDSQILSNLEIVVRPNETIGIVGESGAGKTTFFHLLTGLLQPYDGHITIGDTPYSEIDATSLQKRMGYVTQEPIIFSDTVANNITLWQHQNGDQSSMERIRDAARTAKCDEFIQAMKDGYDSALGERGVNLSGGERQRIAIAREVFKNPSMLIFDEAASALDARSEHFVRESIEQMHGQRTIIIITHRLASVRLCDRIYVFKSGRVVEQGNFDKLYNAVGSHFRRMYDLQGSSQ
jgi:ABC-type multidrug transport system fused ATPase/permease subunit